MFPNRGMTLLEDRKLEYQERKKHGILVYPIIGDLRKQSGFKKINKGI